MIQQPIAATIAAVSALLTSHEPVFQNIGINLWGSLAVMLVIWTGLSIAMGAGFEGLAVAKTFFLIMMVRVMLVFYIAPIPSLGVSFSKLIPSGGQYLSAKLDQQSIEEADKHFDDLLLRLESPSLTSISENLTYLACEFVIVLGKIGLMIMIVGSLVTLGVTTLMGPLLIPWLLIRPLNWLFWGYLRTVITVTMIVPLSIAWCMVGESFAAGVSAGLPATIPAADYITYIVSVGSAASVLLLGAFIVPLLAHQLFGAASAGASTVLTMAAARMGR